VRRGRIAAVVMTVLAIAPSLLLAIWAARVEPDRRDIALGLFLESLILPALLGPFVWLLVDRRGRGLVFTAVRGGRDAAIEVRPKSGVGRGLVIPIRDVGELARVYRVGYARHIVVAEALTPTSAGEVLFARGGTKVHPDLVYWLKSVLTSDGSCAWHPDSFDVEAIASQAAADPLDAPPPLQARLVGGWPTYSYQAVEPRGVGMAVALIALLVTWLVACPLLGIFSFAKLAVWLIPIVLFLVWMILLAGPLTVELEVRASMLIFRRRRFGLTLFVGINEASQAGLDISQLPFVALRFPGRRLRGFTTPAIGGPDVVAMAWLSAAIRACAQPGVWRA
jgi:hypothetical protein